MFKNLFRAKNSSDAPPDSESLLKAMYGIAQSDTPENRDRVYREFLKSWLWICVAELPRDMKPGTSSLEAGTNIPVLTPNNAKGNRVLPAFTDPTALANYDPNSPHLAFPAIEVFKMALNLQVAEVVVNAFDPIRKPVRPGGVLMRHEFEALAQGMVPKRTLDGKGQVLTVQKTTRIQIRRCEAPVDAELKTRLGITALTFPELKKIFRYQMRYLTTGTQSEVFGVLCNAKADRFEKIVGSLMASVQPLLAPERSVDFISLSPDHMPMVEAHGELLYERPC